MLRWKFCGIVGLVVLGFQCSTPADEEVDSVNHSLRSSDETDTINPSPPVTYTGVLRYVEVTHNVDIGGFFSYMDSVVNATDSSKTMELDEYILVHFNPWIIDTLKSSDYYVQMERGIFLYDQSKKIVLHANDSLAIPDYFQSALIRSKLKSTVLDLNIPEYTLRIIQWRDTVLKTKVRVGRNEIKYLELAGHDVDLRTPIGTGEIIRVEKNPIVINPETAVPYKGTYRDDGRFTKMPVIPWLEPEINGVRYGTLIHPTTNPATLGFAYSHGCVGTSEADAWVIYYNAPIGTKVNFRYDLTMVTTSGDSLKFADIYQLGGAKKMN